MHRDLYKVSNPTLNQSINGLVGDPTLQWGHLKFVPTSLFPAEYSMWNSCAFWGPIFILSYVKSSLSPDGRDVSSPWGGLSLRHSFCFLYYICEQNTDVTISTQKRWRPCQGSGRHWPPTTEAQVWSQFIHVGFVVEKWHMYRFSSKHFSFPCPCHSTNAPYSLNHPSPTVYSQQLRGRHNQMFRIERSRRWEKSFFHHLKFCLLIECLSWCCFRTFPDSSKKLYAAQE